MNDHKDERFYSDLSARDGRRAERRGQPAFAELEIQIGPADRQGIREEGISRIVAPDPWSREKSFEQDFRYISREQLFVHKGKELEHVTEDTAEFVPFHTYWPTYDEMQPSQLKWYLFWRGEVRAGRYPDTDLSYLFVYLYELIHGIGWADPSEGYTQIERVWQAYRERYPKLDNYSREWLYDFALIFHLDQAPVNPPLTKLPRSLSMELKELEWQRKFSAHTLELSWELLRLMIDYEAEKSRYYIEQGRKSLRHYAPRIVTLVDGFLTKTKGSRLLDLFVPRERKVSRYLFRSAVYDHSLYGRTREVTVLPYSEHPPLRAYLTHLVRFTENKLRELDGYKGRLKGVTVEPDIDKLISRYLQTEFTQRQQEEARARLPKVKINAAKLRKLKQESDEVRDMLLSEEEQLPEQGQKDISKKDSRSAVPSVRPVQAELDFEHGWQAEESTAELPLLTGAQLLPRREGTRAQAEQAWESGADKQGRSSENKPAVAVSSAISDAWQELLGRLSACQRQVLISLLDGQGSAGLQAIAEQAGSMPELLIDDINHLAMEWLGDLLIDGEELLAEYRTELERVLQAGQ
ncbi:TerB N-terminal domain-containing protein [Paenibacillus sanguinis]|uniref:TerB N-terminal domain-containing protein n=1 Tax=Paenibacillus sanguinis TaxID=225906 RepID=UPI0003823908|nr:TerB N-terminal domain-containing protein [Paenibacillus sanguinis]